MKNFLSSYYKKNINLDELKNFNYVLLECDNCKLIFQEQIPNEKFSLKLYEDIINKDESLQKKDDYEKKNHKKLSYEIGLIKGLLKKKNEEIKI